MKKRLLFLLVSVCITLTYTLTSFATETANTSSNIFENQIVSTTSNMLQFIEPEKEMYGLGTVDFSTLKLGNRIPSYILSTEGLKEETDTLFYPLISDNKWVATATVITSKSGKPIVQISTAYANLATPEDQVALIFDRYGASLLNGTSIIEADRLPYIDSSKLSLETYSNNLSATTACLEEAYELKIDSFQSPRSFERSHYLSVPLILQDEGSKQCWAACIASIRGYYGNTTTIDDVYEFTNVTKYLAQDIEQVETHFDDYQLLTQYINPYLYSFYELRSVISLDEYPIYAHLEYGGGTGHAVVIRGFYVNQDPVENEQGSISYMDPLDGLYASCSVVDDTFNYIRRGTTGPEYSMSDFLIVYE